MAPNVNCRCPPHYKGMFCEEKMENVIGIIFYCVLSISFYFIGRLCLSNGQAYTQAWWYSIFLNNLIMLIIMKTCMQFQITRLCDKISDSSTDNLKNCKNTKRECVTYSRSGRYTFKCYETGTSQERGGEEKNNKINILL